MSKLQFFDPVGNDHDDPQEDLAAVNEHLNSEMAAARYALHRAKACEVKLYVRQERIDRVFASTFFGFPRLLGGFP